MVIMWICAAQLWGRCLYFVFTGFCTISLCETIKTQLKLHVILVWLKQTFLILINLHKCNECIYIIFTQCLNNIKRRRWNMHHEAGKNTKNSNTKDVFPSLHSSLQHIGCMYSISINSIGEFPSRFLLQFHFSYIFMNMDYAQAGIINRNPVNVDHSMHHLHL